MSYSNEIDPCSMLLIIMCVSIYMANGINYSHYNYDVGGGGAKCNPHDWHKINCIQKGSVVV